MEYALQSVACELGSIITLTNASSPICNNLESKTFFLIETVEVKNIDNIIPVGLDRLLQTIWLYNSIRREKYLGRKAKFINGRERSRNQIYDKTYINNADDDTVADNVYG